MWAEYVVTPAQFCLQLHKNVDLEQGAALLINPIVAWALMHEARRGRYRAVVQTAAASALGRCVLDWPPVSRKPAQDGCRLV